jgi:uncharacterized protein (UPF0261 family)
MSVVIVGMLDEREEALDLIKECIEHRGLKTCLIDISVGTGAIVPTIQPDVSCRELADLAANRTGGNTGKTATSVMTEGLKAKVLELHKAGELQGIIAITGMTGALISLPAMKQLPFGVPKVLISGATSMPIHAGQFADFFAFRDITVMHTVVDTVGMNALVRTLAMNGANAIAGMVEGSHFSVKGAKPLVAITEFGFCDKGAHYIRELLQPDYEMVSFHAQGLGDRAAMDLIPQGMFKAVIDLVPGAFSEYLLGGNRGVAGPNRLDLASRLPIPYIFCPGGFDLISCGPMERKDGDDPLWSSRKLAQRKLYIQDPPRVQARMNAEELQQVAVAAAERLNGYEGKERVKMIIPLKGFSSLSVQGGPLYEPDADKVFPAAIRSRLDPAIEVTEVDSDINSPMFAQAVVDALAKALLSL